MIEAIGADVGERAVTVALSLASAICGGLVVAFTLGWRMGRWRAHMEGILALLGQRLGTIEKRLDDGDDALRDLPAFRVEVNHLLNELKLTRLAMGELVTRRECALRHGKPPKD